MKKALFLMILLFVGIVIASPSFFYKMGDVIDLKVPCDNAGKACSGSAVCNVSIMYPNATTFIDTQTMSNNGDFHNYTLSDTDVPGEYQTIVFCVDGNQNGTSTFSFKINTSGDDENDQQILAVYMILIAMVFGYLYAAFKLDEGHIIPRMILFFTGILNLVVALLISYIDLVYGFSTSKMILYLFEGNIFIVMILMVYFLLDIIKKSANIKEKKSEVL